MGIGAFHFLYKLEHSSCIFAIFSKGDSFYHFQFAFQNKSISMKGYIPERICSFKRKKNYSYSSNFFHSESTSIKIGRQTETNWVASLKVH